MNTVKGTSANCQVITLFEGIMELKGRLRRSIFLFYCCEECWESCVPCDVYCDALIDGVCLGYLELPRASFVVNRLERFDGQAQR